jgi:tetratricopeptide (TPR) repeat protein
VYLLRAGEYRQAMQTCEAGLALYPGDSVLDNIRAVALLEMEHHTEALAVFEELLTRVQQQGALEDAAMTRRSRESLEALLLNNVAYASLLSLPESGMVQRAVACGRQAFRMAPWMREIRGTWGATLVEAGDVEQGLKYLAEAAREAETPRARAANLAASAIGHHRLGREDDATRLFLQAEQLDPSAAIVKRARAELALAA